MAHTHTKHVSCNLLNKPWVTAVHSPRRGKWTPNPYTTGCIYNITPAIEDKVPNLTSFLEHSRDNSIVSVVTNKRVYLLYVMRANLMLRIILCAYVTCVTGFELM